MNMLDPQKNNPGYLDPEKITLRKKNLGKYNTKNLN